MFFFLTSRFVPGATSLRLAMNTWGFHCWVSTIDKKFPGQATVLSSSITFLVSVWKIAHSSSSLSASIDTLNWSIRALKTSAVWCTACFLTWELLNWEHIRHEKQAKQLLKSKSSTCQWGSKAEGKTEVVRLSAKFNLICV